jgi:hypothetical protein
MHFTVDTTCQSGGKMKNYRIILFFCLATVLLLSVFAAQNAVLASQNNSTSHSEFSPLALNAPAYGNWTYSLNTSATLSGCGLAPCNDGGYIFSWNQFRPSTSSDAWLVKVDSAGVPQWNKTYGGTSGEIAPSIVNCSDGGYVFTGYTASYGAGQTDMWLVKVDQNGVQQWAKTFGGTQTDYGMCVISTSDGGYAAVGLTNSAGAGDNDFYVVKTDSTGNLQWSKTYGYSGSDIAYGVVETSDSGFVVVGYTTVSGGSDGLAVKLDSAGNVL